jgi:hypothetical protein
MYLPCLRPVQSPSSPPPADLATPALLQLHTLPHFTHTTTCSTLTPAHLFNATPLRTPHPDPQFYTPAPTRVSLCISTVKEALDTQSEEGPSNQPELASVQNVTPDQPEPESTQEDVACDQSEVVSEPTVCP